jgi:hypothetical protein
MDRETVAEGVHVRLSIGTSPVLLCFSGRNGLHSRPGEWQLHTKARSEPFTARQYLNRVGGLRLTTDAKLEALKSRLRPGLVIAKVRYRDPL